MKTLTICKSLFVASLVQCMVSQAFAAQSENLNVTAGNLNALLGSDKETITDLVLTGQINALDIDCLRSMPKLTSLDLSGVNLVAGGNFVVAGIDVSVTDNQLPNYAFFAKSKWTSLKLPNSITAIGNFAVHDCEALETVALGSGVNSIGNTAFCGSVKLKAFTVADDNATFCALDGVLFSKNKDLMVHFPNSKSTVYTIPESVTTIVPHAFCGSVGLTTVTIPENVTSIGVDAFYGCTALTEIVCNAPNAPNLLSDPFFNVNKEDCKLVVPQGALPAYKNAPYWRDFKNIVEKGLTSNSEADAGRVAVYGKSGTIVVSNVAPGENVTVFSTTGILLNTTQSVGDEIRFDVPENQIYLVRAGNKMFKVAF